MNPTTPDRFFPPFWEDLAWGIEIPRSRRLFLDRVLKSALSNGEEPKAKISESRIFEVLNSKRRKNGNFLFGSSLLTLTAHYASSVVYTRLLVLKQQTLGL